MNKWIGMGRLTADPNIRYSSDLCIARYTLAIDRKGKDKGTDFISCVAFGKGGEFAEKYLKKGIKIAVTGRIQTGSYDDKDGKKVYTTEIVVEDHEFAESKGDSKGEAAKAKPDEFVPAVEEELPFI